MFWTKASRRRRVGQMSSWRGAVVGLALATSACATPPMTARAPTPGAPHFTVQTYNIYFRTPADPSTLAAIGRAGADVVCLQEVNLEWADAIQARYAEAYPHMLFRPEAGAGGYAVLSRFPLVDFGIHEAPHHPGWHVLAETPVGLVEILLVHLRAHFRGGSGPIRAYLSLDSDHVADIERFSAACSGERPMIVVGDFNEEDGGSAVAFLRDLGMQDALPLFHPGQPTYRHERAFAGQLEAAIDHIFFDEALEPLNAYVVDAGGSDHYPVVAHFEGSP